MTYGELREQALQVEREINRLFEESDQGGFQDGNLETLLEAHEAFIGVIRSNLGITERRPSDWPVSL